MTTDASCMRCGAAQETTIHVMWDYRFAAEVWHRLVSKEAIPSFFGSGMDNWLLENLKGKVWVRVSTIEGPVLFAVVCWFL